jgi:hypothetical protein
MVRVSFSKEEERERFARELGCTKMQALCTLRGALHFGEVMNEAATGKT